MQSLISRQAGSLGLIPINALVLINERKLRLVGYPSVILGPDLTGDKLHGPMGIEATFQNFCHGRGREFESRRPRHSF